MGFVSLASARPEMELLREVASLLAETCLTIAVLFCTAGAVALLSSVLPTDDRAVKRLVRFFSVAAFVNSVTSSRLWPRRQSQQSNGESPPPSEFWSELHAPFADGSFRPKSSVSQLQAQAAVGAAGGLAGGGAFPGSSGGRALPPRKAEGSG